MRSTKTEPFIAYLIPSLNQVLWLALFFGILAIGPAMMNMDGDLGRHITIGRYILNNRQIPTTDIFSHSMAGEPLTPHEWLAQVIFALSDQILGLDGVVIVTALVIATTFSLVFRQSVRLSGSLVVSLVFTILGAGASSLHWLTRPHVFTFLFLVLWIGVLENLRLGKERRWLWMPVLMILWANTHGAFFAGFVVWGIYLFGWVWEKWIEGNADGYSPTFLKSMLLGGAISLAVTLGNPSGFQLWETSLGYLHNSYLVGHTAEYLSPDFHSTSTWLFLLLILLVIFLFGLSRTPRKALAVFLTGAFMVMGLVSARNIPLFAIVAAPVLAVTLMDWLKAQAGQQTFISRFLTFDKRLMKTESTLRGAAWPVIGFILAVGLSMAGVSFDSQHQGNQFDPSIFPVSATDWLQDHPQIGAVFNYFPWGGYLLYRDWPATHVFIDGQTDFYGEALTRKYETVLSLTEGWQDILKEYQIGWVIFPADSKLVARLANDPDWQVVFQDSTAAIIQHRQVR